MGRKLDRLEAAAKDIPGAFAVQCDVTDSASVDAAFAKAREDGPINILVNNAGAAWGAPLDEFPESGWDKVMDLNVKTPFFLIQALHGALKAAASPQQPAKVINIASIDGLSVNMMETYSYAASKSGIIHLTKRLGMEMAKENINVTALAPGAFASSLSKVARDHADMVSTGVPSGRVGEPSAMAGAAIFLASRAGDYVVGSTLVVDGGVAQARGAF